MPRQSCPSARRPPASGLRSLPTVPSLNSQMLLSQGSTP